MLWVDDSKALHLFTRGSILFNSSKHLETYKYRLIFSQWTEKEFFIKEVKKEKKLTCCIVGFNFFDNVVPFLGLGERYFVLRNSFHSYRLETASIFVEMQCGKVKPAIRRMGRYHEPKIVFRWLEDNILHCSSGWLFFSFFLFTHGQPARGSRCTFIL